MPSTFKLPLADCLQKTHEGSVYVYAWLTGYTQSYVPQLRQKNGCPQELKKFRRVHYQRFMIITLYLFRRNSYCCMPYSVSDIHNMYSWLQNNYCYETAHKLTPRSFISHATLSSDSSGSSVRARGSPGGNVLAQGAEILS